jgi:hypothetical protein
MNTLGWTTDGTHPILLVNGRRIVLNTHGNMLVPDYALDFAGYAGPSPPLPEMNVFFGWNQAGNYWCKANTGDSATGTHGATCIWINGYNLYYEVTNPAHTFWWTAI